MYELIEDIGALNRAIKEIRYDSTIGVDLEADSMFHYREKVCLLQIASQHHTFIIDPLAVKDLSSLLPIFKDHKIRKIFHGADYDIRSLFRDFGITVNGLFDTQIAARYLGIKAFGLADLLNDILGISIKKKFQKKDWSKRPLPQDMLAYAAEDVFYLIPLSKRLEAELRDRQRFLWVLEECDVLSKARPAPNACNPLFMNFKGASRLDPRSLAVLEMILELRNQIAKRRDLPPFKILSNEKISEIVDKKPCTEKELEAFEGLSPLQKKMLGRSLLKKVNETMNFPENTLPLYPRKEKIRVPPHVSKRVKLLKEWREKKSRKIKLHPALIMTNGQITSLAFARPTLNRDLGKISEIRTWQRQVFGSEICGLLSGTD